MENGKYAQLIFVVYSYFKMQLKIRTAAVEIRTIYLYQII